MVKKEKFIRDIREIYAEGDLFKSWELLNDILDRKDTDSSGDPIDYDFILTRFRDFHHSWNIKFGKQMAKGFLSKEAEASRKTIYHFLAQALYLQNYETTLVNFERDRYLFDNQHEKLYDGIKRIEQELLAKR